MTITALTSLITIVMIPLGGVVGFHKCGDIVGEYNHESKIVYLCEGMGNSDFYKYHEVAHYFYFNIMSKEQKDQYHIEYLKAYSQGIGSFYREYGYRDEEEDFADNFSLLILGEKQDYKIQKRINLIRKFLKPYIK